MIHRALRLLRIYHNLKQKDLATKLQISTSHLSELESGKKGVSFDLLEKYSAIFRLPVSSIALFAEAAENKPTSILNKLPLKAIQLLEWLESMADIQSEDDCKKSL